MWHLDGSTAEATKQVRDDVVFDFVLGEPGEHREQPKHHGFDLGWGTSGGKTGRFSVSAVPAWALQVGEGLQYPVAAHHSFKIHSKCDGHAYCTVCQTLRRKSRDFLLRTISTPCAWAGGLLTDATCSEVYKTRLEGRDFLVA